MDQELGSTPAAIELVQNHLQEQRRASNCVYHHQHQPSARFHSSRPSGFPRRFPHSRFLIRPISRDRTITHHHPCPRVDLCLLSFSLHQLPRCHIISVPKQDLLSPISSRLHKRLLTEHFDTSSWLQDTTERCPVRGHIHLLAVKLTPPSLQS